MDPKERILDVSARLFAEKGFSAVGVREIANEANVNISMISYYFNGKNGILVELMKKHFEELENITIKVKQKNLNQEASLNELIKEIVDFIIKKHYYCKATINEMPLNIPELYDLKLGMFGNFVKSIKHHFSLAKHETSNTIYDVIIGGAFISMIFSNFIFGDMLKRYYNIEYDEKFIDYYSSIISTLFLSGIKGISNTLENLKEKYEVKNEYPKTIE